MCVCVCEGERVEQRKCCLCVCEREERERGRESVCVCDREDGESVCGRVFFKRVP